MKEAIALMAAPGLAALVKALGETTAGGEIKIEVGKVKLTLRVNARIKNSGSI